MFRPNLLNLHRPSGVLYISVRARFGVLFYTYVYCEKPACDILHDQILYIMYIWTVCKCSLCLQNIFNMVSCYTCV